MADSHRPDNRLQFDSNVSERPTRWDLHESLRRLTDPEDLELAWLHGQFSCGPAPHLGMPDLSCSTSDLYKLHSREEIGRVSVPVLLHLHGAFGLAETEVILAALARRAGFAFFAPDSFSRKMRFSNCQIENCETGAFPLADLYHRAELLDAVRRVEACPFIEPGPLVVSGFSEGGAAVSI